MKDWLGITGLVGKPYNEHPKRPVLGFECTRSEVCLTERIGSENYMIQVTVHRRNFEHFVEDVVSAILARCTYNLRPPSFTISCPASPELVTPNYSGPRLIRPLDNWASCLIGPNSSTYLEVELSGTHVKWSA